MKRSLTLFCLLAVLGAWSADAVAIPKFARTGGNWTTAGNWSNVSCAAAGATTFPTAADDVTICNGIAITVDGVRAALSVTIAGGNAATGLAAGGAGSSLAVTNNVTINAPTAAVTKQIDVGARAMTIGGALDINGGTAGGAGTISRLLLATGGTVSVTGNVTIDGGSTANNEARIELAGGTFDALSNVTLTGGGANPSTALLTLSTGLIDIRGNLVLAVSATNNSRATASVTSTGTLRVRGNVTMTGGANANRDALLTVSTGLIQIDGNLTINASVATSSTASITGVGGRITVNGATGVTNGDVVSVAAGGTFSVTGAAPARYAQGNNNILTNTTVTGTVANPSTLAIAGNATVTAGTANPSGATLTVAGADGRMTVGGNLVVAGGSNTATVATVNVTSTAPAVGLAVTGDATVSAGSNAGGDATLTTANGRVTIGGALGVNAGTADGAIGTASVTGTGRMTVTGNVTLTGGANNTRDALLTVSGVSALGNGVNVGGALNLVSTVAGSAIAQITNAGTGRITVSGAGGVTNDDLISITGTGIFAVSGTFTSTSNGTFTNVAAGQLNLGGATSTVDGTFNRGTGTVTMNGVAAQNLSGSALAPATGLYNFTINNASGVTLGSDVGVANTLTFTAGDITTGSSTLTMGSTAPAIAGATAARHVVGNLARVFPAVAGTSYVYTVGDGTNYTPVTITFPGAPTSGSLTVSTAVAPAGDHPNTTAGTSGITSGTSVNRYWGLKDSTLAGTATVTFTYLLADNDVPGSAGTYAIRRGAGCAGTGSTRTCQPWLPLNVSGVPTTTTAVASLVGIAVGASAEFDVSIGVLDPTINFQRERQFIYTREQY